MHAKTHYMHPNSTQPPLNLPVPPVIARIPRTSRRNPDPRLRLRNAHGNGGRGTPAVQWAVDVRQREPAARFGGGDGDDEEEECEGVQGGEAGEIHGGGFCWRWSWILLDGLEWGSWVDGWMGG